MPAVKRVLVVDDEPKIVQLARDYLEHAGFSVQVAYDGRAALSVFRSSRPDLVVLDLGLPEIDGLDVTRAVRGESAVPIVMLTGRSEESDKLVGLELGADDYLVKPFAFSELLARVRSVLRRGPKQAGETVKIGDLEIEPRRRRVSRGDKKIDLTAKEYALLDYLVRNAGEVLSRTLIAEHVWDMNFDSDTNVVDVAMRRLRAKVDDPFDVKLIRTIRGVGYLLEEPAA